MLREDAGPDVWQRHMRVRGQSTAPPGAARMPQDSRTGPREPPLIGVSASVHDFGDYGGVGVHRPVSEAGGLPTALPHSVWLA